MSKPVMVTIEVWNDNYIYGGPVIEFIRELSEKVASIPPEFRDTAEIEFDVEHGYYDSTSPSVRLFYRRPKTAAETEARKRRERIIKEHRENTEREQLKRLQEKYGMK